MRLRWRSGAPTTSTGSRSADAGDQLVEGVLDGVEQGVLQQDVLDRVAGQRQLGEHGQPDALVVAFAGQPQHRFGVRRRVGQRRVVGARGHPHEAVPVGGVEVHDSIVAKRDAACRLPVSTAYRWGSTRRTSRRRTAPTRSWTSPACQAADGRRVAVLTGAGLSTDSGIPDYRGPGFAAEQPDDDPPVHLRPRVPAAVLGAQSRRVAAHARHASQCRAPGAGRIGARRRGHGRDHPERRPAAHQGGQRARGQPARHVRPGRVPRRAGSRMSRAQLADELEALNPGFAETRRTRSAVSRWPRRRRHGGGDLVVPLRRLPPLRRHAQARHRLLRRERAERASWRRRIHWSTTPTRCSSPARR